jgi:hypothetical protein
MQIFFPQLTHVGHSAMQSKIGRHMLRRFSLFGVPGLALFVFLFLLNRFHWSYETVNGTWAAIIALVFLVLVASIVALALFWYRDGSARNAEKQQHRDRVRIGVQRILDQLTETERKAKEDASRLSSARRGALNQRIDARISSLKVRVRELETEAYNAIDSGNATLGQDVSAQMTQVVTSGIKDLADIVDAETKNEAWAKFYAWAIGLISSGIAISLASFSTTMRDAFKTNSDPNGKSP